MRDKRYALNFTHTRTGLSAAQVRWAREIYEWWEREGSLNMMPKEPKGGKEARGARWRREQQGWAEKAIATRNAGPK